ncbi:hypothetical protein L873DRAFT_24192 [Choiromyces venosus 120613-1]|uniref:Uncharacterized protein n=1 Tax=Choiromyces venosus 120613-1 TaxID=1336337 RepID=A0A3N4K6D0_9PEZI|nr:hypothetical protein L873DRAFT_24192 [Choiromyces venosus 120613-1]
MKFKPCAHKIVLALPALGTLITPVWALAAAKNRFHPHRIPFPLEIIRERVGNPCFRYAEVPVELKEGTAVPEPALVPNRPSDDEIIDRACNQEVRPHLGVASAIKDRYSAAENAKAEENEAVDEIDDIAPIEKRGVLSGLTGEDEEFTQLVQPDPPVTEEEEQREAQVQMGGQAFEKEYNYYVAKHGEKHAARIQEYLDALLKYGGEEWQRGWKSPQDERLEEAEAEAKAPSSTPRRKRVAEPDAVVAETPREPIPDYFDGYIEVPLIPDTTTDKGMENANIISPYLLNRFKPVPIPISSKIPDYSVPVDLLPEALFEAAQEDPEAYIERRTKHRLTILDIPAAAPAPALAIVVPEVAPTVEAKAPAPTSPSLGDATYITPERHIRIARPVIQDQN